MSGRFTPFLKALPRDGLRDLRARWDEARWVPEEVMAAIQTRIRSASAGDGGNGAVEFDKDIHDFRAEHDWNSR
jgi:hypothetical protein